MGTLRLSYVSVIAQVGKRGQENCGDGISGGRGIGRVDGGNLWKSQLDRSGPALAHILYP